MTTSENPTESGPQLETVPAPPDTLNALRQSYQSLRGTLLLVIVSMIILTGSVFLFLLREVSVTRRQVNELTQWVADSEKNRVPVMRLFRDRLIEFAKANPDFRPILSKYVNPTNYSTATPASGSVPAKSDVPPVRMPVAPAK